MKKCVSRRHFLIQAGLGLGFLAGCKTLHNNKDQKKPNFVVIFADDQGYADVGVFGAKGFKTPNLDRMAAEGMQFTSFYAGQAVCSASRAALMTGCYPTRVGIRGALMPWSKVGLNENEKTIADVLKPQGYTCGIFGKWHLGHHHKFLPLQHGFDEYLGLPYSNDMWPVGFDGKPVAADSSKAKYPPLPLIDGNEKVAEITDLSGQDTLTTRYAERAVQFIEKNKDHPFFLYVPHSMPHVPLGVSDKFRGKSEQGMYGDVIMEIDWSVGEILKTLKKHGLDNNTLVIYTSDNGPWLNFGNHAGCALPLREGKGSSWEGGQREPCIMRWPGRIPAGTVCDKIAATIDILPTLAVLADADLPDHKIDGVNILPLLMNKPNANPRNEFYYYYTHNKGDQLQCVRRGKWKLHVPHNYRSYENVEPGKDGFPGPYGSGKTGTELYNLETDISEKFNVADQYPEVVEELLELVEQVRQDLGDVDIPGNGVRPVGLADS